MNYYSLIHLWFQFSEPLEQFIEEKLSKNFVRIDYITIKLKKDPIIFICPSKVKYGTFWIPFNNPFRAGTNWIPRKVSQKSWFCSHEGPWVKDILHKMRFRLDGAQLLWRQHKLRAVQLLRQVLRSGGVLSLLPQVLLLGVLWQMCWFQTGSHGLWHQKLCQMQEEVSEILQVLWGQF